MFTTYYNFDYILDAIVETCILQQLQENIKELDMCLFPCRYY